MREPDYLGNCDLLKKSIIGFFSSRTTAPLSVIPTLDWAHEVARREDAVVMSGFQSAMEREVLDILLGGKCSIINVLNRSIYRQVPVLFKRAFEDGRILFVSLCRTTERMPSVQNAAKRNCYIAEASQRLVFSSLTPESRLYSIYQGFNDKGILLL